MVISPVPAEPTQHKESNQSGSWSTALTNFKFGRLCDICERGMAARTLTRKLREDTQVRGWTPHV